MSLWRVRFVADVRYVALFLAVALCGGLAGCTPDQQAVSPADAQNDPLADSAGEEGASLDHGQDLFTDADTITEPDAIAEPFPIDAQRIFDDVVFLASDELGGRAPGTAGNETALAHIESLFDELGLTPVGDTEGSFRQTFDYEQWSVGETLEVRIDDTALEAGSEVIVAELSGAGMVTAEIVFVGYGFTIPPFDAEDYPDCPIPAETGYDDYAEVDAADYIALVLRHGPNDDEAIDEQCPATDGCDEPPCLWTFGYKAANARAHGAAAMILVQDFAHDPQPPEGITLGWDYFDEAFPVVFALRTPFEAAIADLETWAETIDETLTPASVATGVEASIDVDAGLRMIEAENILGAVEGTDPAHADEVIVIGAHMDHVGTDPLTGEIYNGADDNASGTAVMMELARATVLSGIEPARTVLFAAWNAEEAGLIGSCFYVDHPVYTMNDTVAAFAVDMVGAGDGSGLLLYGASESENAWIAEVMDAARQDAGWSHQVIPMDEFFVSDHTCFAERGVSAVFAESIGPHSTYHTPEDTADNILIDDLESSALLMWAVLQPLTSASEEEFLNTQEEKRAEGCFSARKPGTSFRWGTSRP